MPTAALHSLFWQDQGEAPVAGPVLTALSRYLGPPLTALLVIAISGYWKVLL